MIPFTTLTGTAAPLLQDNIDTDLIIPGRFLKTVKRTGLGEGLFDSLRRNEQGSMNPDFILNRPDFRDAAILIAGENFGCGSSREHAPWALLDFGIQCVIAPSFGDIFFSNSLNCGLLPARLSRENIDALSANILSGDRTLTVDLIEQLVSGSEHYQFAIPPTARDKLIAGLDQIGSTLQHSEAIKHFERRGYLAANVVS